MTVLRAAAQRGAAVPASCAVAARAASSSQAARPSSTSLAREEADEYAQLRRLLLSMRRRLSVEVVAGIVSHKIIEETLRSAPPTLPSADALEKRGEAAATQRLGELQHAGLLLFPDEVAADALSARVDGDLRRATFRSGVRTTMRSLRSFVESPVVKNGLYGDAASWLCIEKPVARWMPRRDGVSGAFKAVGVIDFAMRWGGARGVLVEWKTGKPSAAHVEQMNAYAALATDLFPPDTPITATIVYLASGTHQKVAITQDVIEEAERRIVASYEQMLAVDQGAATQCAPTPDRHKCRWYVHVEGTKSQSTIPRC